MRSRPTATSLIEPGELEAIAPKKTKAIEIEEFVELSQIDPIYYDHPYYLAPGPGGAKPYKLLVEAMRETGKVGIARVVIRSKEALVALRPIGDALGMATMIFADEVLPPERLDEIKEAEEVKTTKRELDIAKQLVESLAADFKPEQLQRRLPRAGARDDRAQGPGQGDRGAARARGGRRAGARPDGRAEGEPRGGAGARGSDGAAAKPKRKAPAKAAAKKTAAKKAPKSAGAKGRSAAGESDAKREHRAATDRTATWRAERTPRRAKRPA